jgi:hypothetical protein
VKELCRVKELPVRRFPGSRRPLGRSLGRSRNRPRRIRWPGDPELGVRRLSQRPPRAYRERAGRTAALGGEGISDAGRRDVLTAMARETEGMFVKLKSGDDDPDAAAELPRSALLNDPADIGTLEVLGLINQLAIPADWEPRQ